MKELIKKIKLIFRKEPKGDILRKAKEAVKANPKEQGFTLIEIIIVVVILGLLMSMIVPQIMDSKAKAEAGMKTFAGQQKSVVSFVETNKDTIITPNNILDCTLNASGVFICKDPGGSGGGGNEGGGGLDPNAGAYKVWKDNDMGSTYYHYLDTACSSWKKKPDKTWISDLGCQVDKPSSGYSADINQLLNYFSK